MGFKSLNSCRKRPCLERVTNVWMKLRRPKYKAFEETLRKLLPFKEWCLEADEIDVKDQKQKNIARNELPEEYRKQADYFHLSNGVLMYRDILNDEWLTDAVVIPPGLENKALQAYHDSGYGAHLGSYKTRIAGKLAYKCTGPYKIVDVNPRNPDVYRLVPLGQPNREPTSHHVRELCPYVTQEAHERQKPAPVGIVEDDLLKELKVGDHLLLKNGKRDYLTLVTKIDGQYVTVQYYNKKKPTKGPFKPMENLNLREIVCEYVRTLISVTLRNSHCAP